MKSSDYPRAVTLSVRHAASDRVIRAGCHTVCHDRSSAKRRRLEFGVVHLGDLHAAHRRGRTRPGIRARAREPEAARGVVQRHHVRSGPADVGCGHVFWHVSDGAIVAKTIEARIPTRGGEGAVAAVAEAVVCL